MSVRRGQLGISFVLAALGLVGLGGCGEPILAPGPGQLIVPWEVLPTGCQEAGLEVVRLSLWSRDEATRAAPASYVAEAPCARGFIAIDAVDYGAYTLLLEGLGPELEPLFIAQPPNLVVIQPEATRRLKPQVLEPKPATLDVIWRFEDGALCGAHGVDRVEVMLFDQAGYVLSSTTRSCALGRARFEGLKAGEYSALVRADEGQMGGMVEVSLEVAKRKGVEVMLRVAE